MNNTKAKAKEYQQRYLERKKNGETRPYRTRFKSGRWSIEHDSARDVAIVTTTLKVKYKDTYNSRLYDDRAYIPMYNDIRRAVSPTRVIISRNLNALSIYIKGISNKGTVMEKAGEVIQGYEERGASAVKSSSEYERNREKRLESQRKYNESHREEIREYKKKYRERKKNSM